MLGMHPGALAQATSDYDAALASGRALAMTSTNGATLVFAPRAGQAGFELRAYAGRPTSAGAVQASTAMPVISDATVSEATLGAPPFAIFFAASGHISGKDAYPAIDGSGNASFAPIAIEPACPAGGFVLTFRSPQGATATRALPCTNGLVAGTPGLPNPSPTPNVPIVTPPQLIYYWPADAEQHFVATEWGYTHWFATTTKFSCGAGIATYPNVLPSPYSAAYSGAEAAATPLPPNGTPYSYPNSGGASMNDAPATFPLDPSSAGLCTAAVRDAYGQAAHTSVQVMGWLTAAYKGASYTHLTKPVLSLPSSDLPSKGASVTIAVSKTYDAQALQPAVALDAACSPYVSIAASGGATPGTPSAAPAQAAVTLKLVTVPGSPVSCGGIIYDQYPGSRGGEGIAFNAAIGGGQVKTWPPVVQYPLPGMDIETAAGAICGTNQPRALDAAGTAALTNANPPAGFDANYRTNANGCLEHYTGAKWIAVDQALTTADGVSVLADEQGTSSATYLFSGPNGSQALFNVPCGAANYNKSFLSSTDPATVIGEGANVGKCGFAVISSDSPAVNANNTVGIDIVARNCENVGVSVYVAPATTCTVGTANTNFTPCLGAPVAGGGNATPGDLSESNIPSFSNTLLPSFSDAAGDSVSAGTYFRDASGKGNQTPFGSIPPSWSWTFSRAAGSTAPVTLYLLNYDYNLAPFLSGLNYVCYNGTAGKLTLESTMTIY